MYTQPRHRHLKFGAMLAVLFSGLLFAVAILNTSDQPLVSIGRYALKSRDLAGGADTRAYRSWFENGSYQGDIIEYEIQAITGVRRTDVAVGDNPATSGTLGYCGESVGSGCWSARATFIANGADNVAGTYWKNRNIFTTNSESGNQVDFLWDNLSAAQKSALDPDIIADPDGDPTTSDAVNPNVSQNNQYFSPILNYVIGDRSNERNQPDGDLRRRYSVLGDITRSPVYIGPPEEIFLGLDGFSEFRSANTLRAGLRAGRIAAPSNDGMLHIFDETNGDETMAYVPSMVIGKLDALASRNATYEHTYYLDGELTVGSAQVDATTCTDTPSEDYSGCNWTTILTGGGGAGFRGLFALNMTDPAYSSTGKVVFEKDGTAVDQHGDAVFGYIYDRPRIGALGTTADPAWYVFTGNGYDSDIGVAKLLMISLDGTHSVISVPTAAGSRGLSAPVLLSSDTTDLMVETVFAGDLNGDLWMFRINKASPASSTAVRVYVGSPDQPITAAPAIAKHPSDNGSYLVYFGTGSILSEHDALDDGPPLQSINAVYIPASWIDGTVTTPTPIIPTDLESQTLDTNTLTAFSQDLRVMSSHNAVDFVCPDSTQDPCLTDLDKGWTLTFPDCGQRLVGTPFVRAGRVQFVTSNPTGTLACNNTTTLSGDSWVMSLDYLTGSDGNTVVYNLNGDGELTTADKVDNKFPVALSLGSGNIAQPAFVRLTDNGIDKMYINGIVLPIPLIPETGPILSGHIDVETDSHYSGVTAPNGVYKHSEFYNVTTNDALGYAVDGHVHDYDTNNGVDYVDLFTLEPRRGLASLAPVTPSTNAGTGNTCGSGENNEQVRIAITDDDGNVTYKCIEAVEGELNRAYSTITPVEPVDDGSGGKTCPAGSTGVYDGSSNLTGCIADPESEVFQSDGSTALSASQKFIVVVTNGDLSNSGTLQIGCRTWKVVDYEDMVQNALEATHLTPEDALPGLFTTADANGDDLIFTLEEIRSGASDTNVTCPAGTEAQAKGLSESPTLRVGFGQRSILDGGIVGTRAQCVLGLHAPTDPVDYTDAEVLCWADNALNGGSAAMCTGLTNPETADPGYIRDPADNLHITEVRSEEGNGYRWRNGALTIQLLAVNEVNGVAKVAFELQPPDDGSNLKYLPVKSNKRFGGTYAKAFSAAKVQGKTVITANETTKGANQSGLLYESSMYWHYSDLADELRTADPASTPCYGDSNWKSRINIELGGLTLGEYQRLTNDLVQDCKDAAAGEECDLDAFARLLGELEAATTEEQRNKVMLQLTDLLNKNADLAQYAKYRDYAPGHVPEQHLLDIDKNQDGSGDGSDNSSSADGTPADVTAIELIDLESLGPTTKSGRHNWIDLRQ